MVFYDLLLSQYLLCGYPNSIIEFYIFYRFQRYNLANHRANIMGKLDLFRSCLNSALDRKYFVDRWISDQSLVTLFKRYCYLDFITKNYFNRYIHSVYLPDYQFYHKIIHKIKNEENKPTKTTFYYFTNENSRIPRYLTTTYEWQQIYDNFRVLRSQINNDYNHDNSIQLETNGKRKQESVNKNVILCVDDNDSANVVTPPTTKQKLSIANLVGNYFSSNDAKILFNSSENETVYDCLTRRIDCFDDILNRKLDLPKIVRTYL